MMHTAAGAGVFGLVLLAVPGYAQTVPPADVKATVISLLPRTVGGVIDDNGVRPFRIDVPEAALVDLRRRVLATRWPDRETVMDQSQGVQLAKIQALETNGKR